MVDADIHHRPLHISILDMYKVFEPLVCCLNGMGAPVYQHSTGQVGPRSGISGLLMEWKCCPYVMFEADNHPVMIMNAGDMIIVHLHHVHQAPLNLMGLVA
jgi:hypothetical protein